MNNNINILYFINENEDSFLAAFKSPEFRLRRANQLADLTTIAENFSLSELNSTILIEVNAESLQSTVHAAKSIKNNWYTRNLAIIFILSENDPQIIKTALELGINDCYVNPIPYEDLKERITFLNTFAILKSKISNAPALLEKDYKIPLLKRAIDILISASALIFLSPILIIVAILIKLDSKGSVFYTSKRVGTGYRIFDFYKFRTMRTDADKEVSTLIQNNQYGNSAFFKLKNDPRVTKLGNFLRNTSIDELPQLLNVLKGEMCLVGNRPLPLYEAELLTTNEWSTRFLGPAGLTGLWQVTKRGKKDMSEIERKELDNYYAANFSLAMDVKIILQTFPALIQKEKV
ncbi:sugar transferase [Daejeonella sp.]|uniref:sugar transferase n=1 Tax=Daejeonella sp. TaxID=2805397 RepID=UPI00398393E9